MFRSGKTIIFANNMQAELSFYIKGKYNKHIEMNFIRYDEMG